MEFVVFVVVFPCKISQDARGWAEEEGDDEVDFFEHFGFGFEDGGGGGFGGDEAAEDEGVLAEFCGEELAHHCRILGVVRVWIKGSRNLKGD